jgi:polar amino acid transport system substrate-binding protein
MRTVSRVLVAAAALAAATSFASAKDWMNTTVVFGADATYPPFESQDSAGNIVGFDVDIGNALCAEAKLKCKFVNQDWDGIIPALLAGKFDGILSSMSITPERAKIISFTDKIYNTPPAIVVPKDSDIKGTTPDDLAGKSIGVQSSTTHAAYAESAYSSSDIRYYKSPDDYKLDIAAGRLDSVMDDVVVLGDWVKSDAGSCCKILGTLPIVPAIHGLGTGIGLRKEDSDLREILNKAIAAIIANGTYKKINDKYFDFNAYGS